MEKSSDYTGSSRFHWVCIIWVWGARGSLPEWHVATQCRFCNIIFWGALHKTMSGKSQDRVNMEVSYPKKWIITPLIFWSQRHYSTCNLCVVLLVCFIGRRLNIFEILAHYQVTFWLVLNNVLPLRLLKLSHFQARQKCSSEEFLLPISFIFSLR